jgi:hypothetical protein
MNPLVEFVKAREALRKKKAEGGPPPHTDNEILQKYRFTNVRRPFDRVSRWLIENVLLEKHIESDLDSFLKFSALCRWVNWPPTIKAIMDAGHFPNKHPNYKAIGKLIDARKKSGEKTWTGAYLIRAKPGSKKGKGHFVAVEVIEKPLTKAMPALVAALSNNVRTRRAVWGVLYNCHNWGPFLSGQVVDDWSWTPLLASALDTFTWAPQGPGSLRGFNRLLGLPLKTRHSEEEWCIHLQMWRKEIIHELGPEFKSMTLMDCQNSLCETDKILRVKNGEGRPRSNYRPETAF